MNGIANFTTSDRILEIASGATYTPCEGVAFGVFKVSIGAYGHLPAALSTPTHLTYLSEGITVSEEGRATHARKVSLIGPSVTTSTTIVVTILQNRDLRGSSSLVNPPIFHKVSETVFSAWMHLAVGLMGDEEITPAGIIFEKSDQKMVKPSDSKDAVGYGTNKAAGGRNWTREETRPSITIFRPA